VLGLGQRSGDCEHIGERDTGPRRGAGRAGTPRCLAGDVADGDQARAPIAGALQRRGLAQRRQREVELALDEPVDAQPPRGGIDLWHGAVPPYVERVSGGQRTLGQRGEPGLGIERLVLVHDQIHALSVPTHATSVRVRTSRPPAG
jgi:hypothetical protein